MIMAEKWCVYKPLKLTYLLSFTLVNGACKSCMVSVMVMWRYDEDEKDDDDKEREMEIESQLIKKSHEIVVMIMAEREWVYKPLKSTCKLLFTLLTGACESSIVSVMMMVMMMMMMKLALSAGSRQARL